MRRTRRLTPPTGSLPGTLSATGEARDGGRACVRASEREGMLTARDSGGVSTPIDASKVRHPSPLAPARNTGVRPCRASFSCSAAFQCGWGGSSEEASVDVYGEQYWWWLVHIATHAGGDACGSKSLRRCRCPREMLRRRGWVFRTGDASFRARRGGGGAGGNPEAPSCRKPPPDCRNAERLHLHLHLVAHPEPRTA